jgi:rhamnulokinase
MSTCYLACDLGAESGRLMLGRLDSGRLTLEEVHRFPNTPLNVGASLHWDIARLWQELKTGLKLAAQRGLPIAGISTDSWGVDYLLLDRNGEVLPPTFHYRDPRTAKGVATVRARLDWPTVFAETGIQFMPLNTIYQLAAEPKERLQQQAGRFLMIADAFNYFLCDSTAPKVEESNASTTQLYNPRSRSWSKSLLTALSLPESLFPPVVPAGTRLGPLRPLLAKEVGLGEVEVLATCSHDTGAAVAAVPAAGADASRPTASRPGAPTWAYLSSGTWSLMGVELAAPLLTDACRELNFTNEIGYGGSVRLLKNISGLWLVQECRRAWAAAGQDYDYATLTQMAGLSPAFRSLVEPTDERFVSPGGMPEKMAAFCRETKQPVPETPGAFTRCALESLALLYRRTLRQIEQLTGVKIERLHVVGGGSRNMLLNEFTANAVQIPVLAGPVEATALGNVAIQAITLGHLPNLAAARAVVRQSFELTEIKPGAAREWEEASRRFEGLKQTKVR